MEFVELVAAVHHALDDGRVPHAFGGALALGFVAAPRGTVDIDVNVFVAAHEFDPVVTALSSLGYRRESDSDEVPIAGIRFIHASDPFPVDVFPALDPRYAEVERRVVRHRFGPRSERLPFLSAEDLCVFKVSFGRPQDWVDLASMARARPELDLDYIEDQLIALRGPTMYPRLARLRGLFR
jgi:hypothetical protein